MYLLRGDSKPVLVFTVEMSRMNLFSEVAIVVPSAEHSASSRTFGGLLYFTFDLLNLKKNNNNKFCCL